MSLFNWIKTIHFDKSEKILKQFVSIWEKKQEMCDKYHTNKELMSNQTIYFFRRQWRNHKSQLKVLKLPQGGFLKK